MPHSIVVLGAGPAGAAVALGLKALGYQVTVVYTARAFASVEGISSRVVEGLKHAGFKRALTALSVASPRNAHWNNQFNQANTEYLIDRQIFDQLIIEDLHAAGIRLINTSASQVKTPDNGDVVGITLQDGQQIEADFLVEARGRSAPSAHLPRIRGPETLSLLQRWSGDQNLENCAPSSAAVSLSEGWAWMAKLNNGQRYLQLTLDVASTQLPPKAELTEYCRQRFLALKQAQPFTHNAQPVGTAYGRTSTAILCQKTVGPNWIRVGDAAMAVDPLSGNGIFQALSSALQAPAVINTLLQHPERRALAESFYHSRVEGLFYRFARIGRDFYRMETQWPEQAFWQHRQSWPDDEPMHQTQHLHQLTIKTMPVVNNGFIEAKEVVVSPDQPLGIWHLAGVELASIVQQIQAGQPLDKVLESKLLPPAVQQIIGGWFAAFNL
ncbi:Dehydrogenase (flavoprotein) [Oceanospirillum multiglobuliferum]|uniref:FAD-dependent oxidoreductase n=1 Tax=Oceanospirillum multiglobuliferum TaxID=64969 RepID=A0A1T4P2W8_9GAMM|nr:tryptophan 7-halogenase [Oceanospirillum multiglobuliferum]OPX55120.1 hypothetical protein BTE48_10865 [Oceanospirillum multiglobuliferum]SJZ85950.1 Dehydrogenase (flavoprotein) [Oceanospirillum multiglobuliferum]